MAGITRSSVLPEPELPDAAELMAGGRQLARTATAHSCPFLATYDVRSESEYKRLEEKLSGDMERLDVKTGEGLTRLDAKIEGLNREMGVQLRWIIGIVIGAMVAMTGVFAWIVDRILTP